VRRRAHDAAVGVTVFEPRKFMCLCPWKSNCLLPLPTGVYSITRLTSREQIEYFLNMKNINMCLAQFCELHVTLALDQNIPLILKVVAFLMEDNRSIGRSRHAMSSAMTTRRKAL
jgi:hypothetical protein